MPTSKCTTGARICWTCRKCNNRTCCEFCNSCNLCSAPRAQSGITNLG